MTRFRARIPVEYFLDCDSSSRIRTISPICRYSNTNFRETLKTLTTYLSEQITLSCTKKPRIRTNPKFSYKEHLILIYPESILENFLYFSLHFTENPIVKSSLLLWRQASKEFLKIDFFFFKLKRASKL